MDKKERDELFQNKYEIIIETLKKRRHKWKLSSLTYMDYNDVIQILSLQIYEKLHLYDTSRPFINWCNKLISNRMQNLVRDNYSNLAPPCNKCPYNEGDNRCGFTKNQLKNSSCSAYAKWEKTKKSGYHLKLAQSLDHPDFIEQRENAFESSNLEIRQQKLTEEFLKSLDTNSKIIFESIFLGNKTEKEVNKLHKISLNDIKKIKALIIEEAKIYLNTDE